MNFYAKTRIFWEKMGFLKRKKSFQGKNYEKKEWGNRKFITETLIFWKKRKENKGMTC